MEKRRPYQTTDISLTLVVYYDTCMSIYVLLEGLSYQQVTKLSFHNRFAECFSSIILKTTFFAFCGSHYASSKGNEVSIC
jgi:hypothetical protein